jgi:thymidylate synthase (FAD)
MDTWRQWIRHRTASVNEYSTRYSEAIDQMHTADEWRLQSQTNKQGSQDGSLDWPPGHPWASNQTLDLTPSDYLSAKEHEFQRRAKALYTERLKFGVAREQARKDLPLSTYTEAYWKIDLHNLLHFLGLRMDSHAQQEIREYANVIGNEIVSHLFPMSWEAFEEYNLYGMQLSRSEVAVIADIIDDLREMTDANYGHMLRDGLGRERISESSATPKAWKGVRSRERDEFIEKATRLNLVRDSDG